MKRKIITCDTCGNDITADDIKYKFKRYHNGYCNMEDFEFTKWERMDMCEKCYGNFIEFVAERMDAKSVRRTLLDEIRGC